MEEGKDLSSIVTIGEVRITISYVPNPLNPAQGEMKVKFEPDNDPLLLMKLLHQAEGMAMQLAQQQSQQLMQQAAQSQLQANGRGNKLIRIH